jgi:hypothetical protein
MSAPYKKPCFIYLVGRLTPDGISGPIKIGISDNPHGRIAGFQTAAPFKLALIAHVMAPDRRYAQAVESGLHETFAEYSEHGEWFDIDPLLAAVELCHLMHEFYRMAGCPDEKSMDEICRATGVAQLMERCLQEHPAP